MKAPSNARENLGLGLKPGDPHYRAYVGPAEDYDLIAGWLSAVSRSLAQDGVLVATFLPGDEDSLRKGWIYPECVNYRPETLERVAAEVNLRFEILDWKHPRQTWALFAAPKFDSTWFENTPLTWNAALERAISQKLQSIEHP